MKHVEMFNVLLYLLIGGIYQSNIFFAVQCYIDFYQFSYTIALDRGSNIPVIVEYCLLYQIVFFLFYIRPHFYLSFVNICDCFIISYKYSFAQ